MNVSSSNSSAPANNMTSTSNGTAAAVSVPMPSLPHPSKNDFPGSLLAMFKLGDKNQERCKYIFEVLIKNAEQRGYANSIKWGGKKKWLVTNEDSIYNTEFTATGRFSGSNSSAPANNMTSTSNGTAAAVSVPMPSLPHPSKNDFPGSLLAMFKLGDKNQERCKYIFEVLIKNAEQRGYANSIKWGGKKKWLVTNEDSIYNTEFTATGRFSGSNSSAPANNMTSTSNGTAAAVSVPMPSLPHPSKNDFPGSLLAMFKLGDKNQERCKYIFEVLIKNAEQRGYANSIKWGGKKKWLVTNEDSIYNTEFTATGRFSGSNSSAPANNMTSTSNGTAAAVSVPMPSLPHPSKNDFPGSLLAMFKLGDKNQERCKYIFEVLIKNAEQRGYANSIKWGGKKKWLVTNEDSIYNTEFTATGRFSG
ncbi:predicted protein [Chaetoceros tenuissimus]|uniref:Uncharacterized protein n=1 Tax=Chaetoceros tenuissimus TaxID=426638 RepID=A0AAD3CTM5_9STRA|nr:predicted protein [Chaetoceros tenuissimus]